MCMCVTRRANAASRSSALLVGAARPLVAEHPQADERDDRHHRQYGYGQSRIAREFQVNDDNSEDDHDERRDAYPAAADMPSEKERVTHYRV